MIERPCICSHPMHDGACTMPTRSRYASGACRCTDGVRMPIAGDVIEVLRGDEWAQRTVEGPDGNGVEFWAGTAYRYVEHGRKWRWPARVEDAPK